MEGSVARLADDGQKKRKKKKSARQWPPVDDKRGRRGDPPAFRVRPSLPPARSFPCKDRNRPLTFRRVIGPGPTLSPIDPQFADFARVNVSRFTISSPWIRLLPILLSYRTFFWKRNQASIYRVLCIGFRPLCLARCRDNVGIERQAGSRNF